MGGMFRKLKNIFTHHRDAAEGQRAENVLVCFDRPRGDGRSAGLVHHQNRRRFCGAPAGERVVSGSDGGVGGRHQMPHSTTEVNLPARSVTEAGNAGGCLRMDAFAAASNSEREEEEEWEQEEEEEEEEEEENDIGDSKRLGYDVNSLQPGHSLRPPHTTHIKTRTTPAKSYCPSRKIVCQVVQPSFPSQQQQQQQQHIIRTLHHTGLQSQISVGCRHSSVGFQSRLAARQERRLRSMSTTDSASGVRCSSSANNVVGASSHRRSSQQPKQQDQLKHRRTGATTALLSVTSSHRRSPHQPKQQLQLQHRRTGATTAPLSASSSSSMPTRARAATHATCCACMEELPRHRFPAEPLTAGCTHPLTGICTDCIRSSLAVQVANNGGAAAASVVCQLCQQPLTHADMRRHAAPADFAKFDERAALAAMEQMPGFFWCPAPGCGSAQLHGGGDGEPIVTCVRCAGRFCFVHRCEWHYGATCREYDEQNNGNGGVGVGVGVGSAWRGTAAAVMDLAEEEEIWRAEAQQRGDDMTAFEAARRLREQRRAERAARQAEERAGEAEAMRTTKRCIGPNCTWRAEKDDACKHVTCVKCRYEYCWECRKPWVTGHLGVRCSMQGDEAQRTAEQERRDMHAEAARAAAEEARARKEDRRLALNLLETTLARHQRPRLWRDDNSGGASSGNSSSGTNSQSASVSALADPHPHPAALGLARPIVPTADAAADAHADAYAYALQTAEAAGLLSSSSLSSPYHPPPSFFPTLASLATRASVRALDPLEESSNNGSGSGTDNISRTTGISSSNDALPGTQSAEGRCEAATALVLASAGLEARTMLAVTSRARVEEPSQPRAVEQSCRPSHLSARDNPFISSSSSNHASAPAASRLQSSLSLSSAYGNGYCHAPRAHSTSSSSSSSSSSSPSSYFFSASFCPPSEFRHLTQTTYSEFRSRLHAQQQQEQQQRQQQQQQQQQQHEQHEQHEQQHEQEQEASPQSYSLSPFTLPSISASPSFTPSHFSLPSSSTFLLPPSSSSSSSSSSSFNPFSSAPISPSSTSPYVPLFEGDFELDL